MTFEWLHSSKLFTFVKNRIFNETLGFTDQNQEISQFTRFIITITWTSIAEWNETKPQYDKVTDVIHTYSKNIGILHTSNFELDSAQFSAFK